MHLLDRCGSTHSHPAWSVRGSIPLRCAQGGEQGRTAHHERKSRHLRSLLCVRPEVYPPSAAPEATRVSKGERGFQQSPKPHLDSFRSFSSQGIQHGRIRRLHCKVRYEDRSPPLPGRALECPLRGVWPRHEPLKRATSEASQGQGECDGSLLMKRPLTHGYWQNDSRVPRQGS